MSKDQTDNSNFRAKVHLRQSFLPKLNQIKVLDAFSGNGAIWKKLKQDNPKINIEVLRIDNQKGKSGTYLKGDNLKFIKNMNLKEYDIIDLDAYGIPYKQLDLIFKMKYCGLLFVTFINKSVGNLPKKFMRELGYSNRM